MTVKEQIHKLGCEVGSILQLDHGPYQYFYRITAIGNEQALMEGMGMFMDGKELTGVPRTKEHLANVNGCVKAEHYPPKARTE
jgi:hypothetical protein